MADRTIVLLNMRARNTAAAQLQGQIQAAFGELDYPATIKLVRRNLDDAVRRAIQDGFTTVVAAGGDGTIRAVATALIHYGGARLGVIPVGTFNHFAKTLGLPLDVPGAVQAIAAGRTRPVDAAAVNGRFFINSATLGLHPLFVRRRQRHERRLGKWLAIPVAAWHAAVAFRAWRFTLHIGRHHEVVTTPFVFIGQNEYQLRQLGLQNLDKQPHELFVYVLQCRTRRQLIGLALRGLLGDPADERYFKAYAAADCQIMARQPLYITLDGELARLKPPLEFTVRPHALEVLVPAKP
jgi:diacylglycerol kinase family enzyme